MQFLYLAPVGLVQTNLTGDIEMMNPMAAQLLMQLSTGGNFDNLFAVLEQVTPQIIGVVRDFSKPSGPIVESLRVCLDDDAQLVKSNRFMSISMQKLGGSRLMTMLSDVTLEVEREQLGLKRRLHDASRVDKLTQMPNREAIKDHLVTAMARKSDGEGSEFAVLFMNCDRFRLINDSLGQVVGDAVLNLIAERLRATLRLTDRLGRSGGKEQIAARLGGDEFVVVLDQMMRPDDVHAVAQRLIEVLSKPYGIGLHQLYCSISMGIVMRAQAVGDADSVLRDASIAMVEAKRVGGARYVVFAPSMQELAFKRSSMEAALRLALSEGQLFVVYQPVVGLMPHQVIDPSAGVEALVRWQHPERGVVPPYEFISLAEQCGMINELGDFVLQTACRQFMHWQEVLGIRAPRLLAVNLSRAQLDQPGFVVSVRNLLQSCNMSAQHLQLEVTESLAAQDEKVQAQMHALKALGLTLALDDFGTGYSSLSSLHQFPVDIVKIDRSFTSQADCSHHHRVLIDATVRVAKSLGLHTVAEGIETQAQADVVVELGCDKGQGYWFSKPLPAGEFVSFIENFGKEPTLGGG
jgi:diguanylate cyclase (GGDEF)-like protein